MTCDEVRELLPEHLLGSLEGPEDLEVRRHLRGCAGCRTDMTALSEGVAWFAHAAHDRTPPDDLHDRVMTTLEQEWGDAPDRAPRSGADAMDRTGGGRRGDRGHARLGPLPGASGERDRRAMRRATATCSPRSAARSSGSARSTRTSRIRSREAWCCTTPAKGQSWGIVLVRAPGVTGTATVTLSSSDGTGVGNTTIDAGTLKFQPDGDAATWLVTSSDLTPFDHMTITAEDGTVLATADIQMA